MVNLLTSLGIIILIAKKKKGERLPDGWKSDIRLYFHRKIEVVKKAKCVPEHYWFRQFVNSYDDATYLLELDLKEYEYARNFFDRFLQLLQENFMIMRGKMEEVEKNARTADFG